MAIVKTSELEGAALDWVVEKATGYQGHVYKDAAGELRHGVLASLWNPSTGWSLGGPLIERYGADCRVMYSGTVEAHVPGGMGIGPTYLIAVMRAIVAAELGDEVDIPDELMELKS